MNGRTQVGSLKVIGYMVAALVVIGLVLNAKDIKRYINIATM